MIEILDYQDVAPFSFDAPRWFDRYERFQIVALEPGKKRRRLVGRWEFRVDERGGFVEIDSQHTRVVTRMFRKGLAVRMWERGVEVWRPSRIRATVGTWAGCAFLAKMRARLAGTAVFLDVDTGSGDDSWSETFARLSAEAACDELRRLRNPPAARKLEVVR